MTADLRVERFCPRCGKLTVWDTPGDGVLQCTNWSLGEPEHCGFTLAAVLTDAEAAAMERYHERISPREANHRDDREFVSSRPRYFFV